MFHKNFKINNVYAFLILLILFLPNVFSQGYIDTRIDSLFLADERVEFNIRVNNPTKEILEGRLFVELIGPESNIELFEDKLYLYPGDLYLKSLNDKATNGDYKIRIELKDKFFETVLDQKILEFKVVSSCNIENICSYDEAYIKCDCGFNSEKRLNNFLIIFFPVIAIGIIIVLYFEMRRRRELG